MLLSFCLTFCQFQPDVAYKSVAYNKNACNQPFLKMHGYDNSLIRKKNISYESLLVYNVHHTRYIENFSIYVSVKYQLNDLVIQHIDGCNSLFI